MNIAIIGRDASEYGRDVREYMREFERRTGHELEVVDPDSLEGIDMCRVYDIVEYPTIIARDNDGKLLQSWRGLPLPLINQLSYYLQP